MVATPIRTITIHPITTNRHITTADITIVIIPIIAIITALITTITIAGGSSVKNGFFLIFFAFIAQRADASSFRNLKDHISVLNFSSAYSATLATKKVKVAVLDNGFADYKPSLGKTLPKDTVYHAGILPPPTPEEKHGRVMAELMTALLTGDNEHTNIPFELHLYSASGYSNLSAAVDDIVKQKVQIVLYAQVWEYGGNFDGTGFINELINKATEAGILWINAAGNFGKNTFNSSISIGEDNWVKLPGNNSSVHVRCLKNTEKKCPLRVVLSWNDFGKNINEGSNKDLDLVLTDDTLNIVGSSSLIQKKEAFPPGTAGYSKYPREIIETTVPTGLYFLRVKAKSSNFSHNRDRLRITTTGDNIEMIHRDENETLLSPADNPSVITAGASDFEESSQSRNLEKPEIFSPSLIELSEEEKYKGTSSAAAIVAAGAVILKAIYPDLDKEQFLKLSVKDDGNSPLLPIGAGMPLQTLRFNFTGRGCFTPVQLAPVDRFFAMLLQQGGVFVQTTGGIKLFMPQDPLALSPNVRRMRPDDMLIIAPMPIGFYLMPRSQQELGLPPMHYEILQTPRGQSICGMTRSPPKSFYLPDLNSNATNRQ